MREKRFSEVSQDYNLLLEAIPYYLKMQQALGFCVRNYGGNIFGNETIKILEVGCGTGITTDCILQTKDRIKIVAIDNEPTMIRQAKKSIGDQRVRFIIKDALEYLENCKNESFHIVVSANTIHNFYQKYREEFLQECFRALKLGGFFANVDKYYSDSEEVVERELVLQFKLYQEIFEKHGRSDLAQKWIEHEKYDIKPDFIMKEKESISQMQKIGFKPVRIIYRNQLSAILIAAKLIY